VTSLRICLTAAAGIAAISILVGQSSHGNPDLTKPVGRIRIGYCGPLRDIDAVKTAGFDYMEVRTSEVAALSDADFERLEVKLKTLSLPVPAAYWFLPAEIKVTGPIDKDRQLDYLHRALPRLNRLGVGLVVFGSSGARQVPEGFSKKEALEQLVDFGKRAGPAARSQNITIAIEPQRREESNIINNTAEALAWVEAVNDPNVQLMIDFYHFSVEKEDPAIISKVKDHLRHIHMANPNKRVMPLSLEEYAYAPFFSALRDIDYRGLIGLEASSNDLQKEGPQSIAMLKQALKSIQSGPTGRSAAQGQ
jgi:D-psicose/D-tagatose/L-ribulose 3-epimerase